MKSKNKVNWISLILIALVIMLGLTSCQSAANTASVNLSTAADNFQINRRIIFYNGITDTHILTIEGLCSLGNFDSTGELSVTCKVGPDTYKKHFLGLSDNVTYFAEQIDAAPADPYHYRVIIRPETIIPGLEMDTSGGQK